MISGVGLITRQGVRFGGAAVPEVSRFEEGLSLNVHQVGLGGLFQLSQHMATVALAGSVHLEHLTT